MENLPQSDISVVGAAITLALFDKLVQRGVIDRGDGLAVLEAAQTRCATISKEAAAIARQLHAHLASGN